MSKGKYQVELKVEKDEKSKEESRTLKDHCC